MEVKIVNLADYPEHIEQVATWVWNEWSKDNGSTLERQIYQVQHALSRDGVPQTFLALKDNTPVGTVALWNNDLGVRQNLRPWLACLFVEKELRGCGIGTALIKHCSSVAKHLGFEKLYLITEHDDYYEKLGWKFIDTAPKKDGGKVKIYLLALSN
ncbi:MAG: GNAT family N-acetyltransferase [Firmicutes bacterium]|nr:GNAT family N-acetyltransferase [Bacillota bacterium]